MITAILVCLVLIGIFALQSWRDEHRVYKLTLATGAKTGEYYPFGEAFSGVVNKYHPEIQIETLETVGSLMNYRLLNDKKVDLAIVQNDTELSADTKAISLLFPEMFHLMARVDAGINSVGDLKGKRIGLMPKGSGSYDLFWPLIKHYGINPKQMKTFPSSPEQAYQDLIDGKLDAVFRIVAVGNSSTIKLLQNSNTIKLVPIDQAGALNLYLPALEASQIPKGTYNGSVPIPPDDLPTVALRAILITKENTPRSIVNHLTTTLFESGKEIAKTHPPSTLITKPNDTHSSNLFFHEGALDYYNNTQPNFFVENADFIGLLMSIAALLASAVWQVRLWLQQKQKNRADRYNTELLDLIKNIELAEDIPELTQVRNRLFDIFHNVVVDLDHDKITSDSFQSFSFTWNVALSTIRHKEMLLNKIPHNEISKYSDH